MPSHARSSSRHARQIDDGSVQRIHSRFVVSQIALANLLSRQYGKGNFTVEVKHNVYCIKVSSDQPQLDLDRPEILRQLGGRMVY